MMFSPVIRFTTTIGYSPMEKTILRNALSKRLTVYENKLKSYHSQKDHLAGIDTARLENKIRILRIKISMTKKLICEFKKKGD